MPTIDVENIPAELLLLMGTRLCMGRTNTSAGGAGTFGVHLLRNDGGSGVIARLISVVVGPGTSVPYNLGPTQNSGTPGGVRAFADTRVFGEGTSLVTQQDNTGLVTGSTFLTLRSGTNAMAIWQPPVAIAVITPGNAFSVSNGNANEGLQVSWVWVERVAQPSELTL